MKRFPRKLLSVPMLVGLACGGAPADKNPTANKDGKSETDPKSKPDDKKPDDKADTGPSKDEVADAAAEVTPTTLGAPAWFSTDLLEHTKVVQDSRSEVRIDGNYSASIILELPDTQTAEGCIKTLHDKIKPHAPGLSEPEETPEGDRQFKGEIPGYQVTCMCGKNNEGKIAAAISYATTS